MERRDAEQLRVVELRGELGVEESDAADLEPGVLADVVEHAEQGEENRHLHEERQTARNGGGAVLLVQGHRLAAHRLTRELIALALVLLLNFSQFRGDFHHLALALDLLDEERDQGRADDDDQADDGQHPRDAVGRRKADGGEEPVPRDKDSLDGPLQGPQDGPDQIEPSGVGCGGGGQ
nr:hypothetical protein GCM10025699_08920 [Microbacterium flavescens]